MPHDPGESAVTEHVFHVAIEILRCGDRAALATLITSQGTLPIGLARPLR